MRPEEGACSKGEQYCDDEDGARRPKSQRDTNNLISL